MTSVRGQVFKLYFRLRNSRLPLDRPIPDQRETLDRRGARLLPMAGGMVAAKVNAYGVQSEWIDEQNTRSDRAFLYLHGGGHFIGSCESHRGFASQIARASRSRLLLPEYRLAPESPFPAGLMDARATYRFLLAQGYPPERIIVGGESSGGGLTLALLQTLRDEGMPMPAGAVLLSAWTDLLGTGESVSSRAKQDPWLRPAGIKIVADRYRGGTPTSHPLVSPLYGDLRGFPPLLIHVGDDEILLDDSTRLASKAAAAGVETTLKIWPGLWHAFHAFYPWVPEARQAHREIGEWVKLKTDTTAEKAQRREKAPKDDSISRSAHRLGRASLGGAIEPAMAPADASGGLAGQTNQAQLGELTANR